MSDFNYTSLSNVLCQDQFMPKLLFAPVFQNGPYYSFGCHFRTWLAVCQLDCPLNTNWPLSFLMVSLWNPGGQKSATLAEIILQSRLASIFDFPFLLQNHYFCFYCLVEPRIANRMLGWECLGVRNRHITNISFPVSVLIGSMSLSRFVPHTPKVACCFCCFSLPLYALPTLSQSIIFTHTHCQVCAAQTKTIQSLSNRYVTYIVRPEMIEDNCALLLILASSF